MTREVFQEKWENCQFLFNEKQYGFANKSLEELRLYDKFSEQDVEYRGNVLLLLAKTKKHINEPEQAGPILKEIFKLPVSSTIQAQSYRLLGTLAFGNGELEAAIHYIEQEAIIWKKITNKDEYASCMYYLGEIFRFLGKFEKSKQFHEQAIEYRKKNIETTIQIKAYISSLNGLAHLYRATNLDSLAEETYKNVLQIDSEHQFQVDVIFDHYNIILLSLGKRIPDDTTFWIKKLESYDSGEFEEIRIVVLKLIAGQISRINKNYSDAIRIFESILPFLEDLPYLEFVVSARLGVIESLISVLGTNHKIDKSSKNNYKTTSELFFNLDYVKESVIREFYRILELCGINKYWTLALDVLFIQINYYQVLDPDYERTLKSLREGIKLARDWNLIDYENQYKKYLNNLQSIAELYQNEDYNKDYEFIGSITKLQKKFRERLVPLLDQLRQKRNL